MAEIDQPLRRLRRWRRRLQIELDGGIGPQRLVGGRELPGRSRRPFYIPPYGPSPRTAARNNVKSLNEAGAYATANLGMDESTWGEQLASVRQGGAAEGAGMATSAAAFEDRDFSIGRVFNRAFGTIGSNPVTTIGISFLFGALPATLVGLGSQYLRLNGVGVMSFWSRTGLTLGASVLVIVFSTVTQGALVQATIAHSDGRQSGFQESAAAGLAVIVPLFLLGLGNGLGIGFGLLLLIIPGVLIWVVWSVAAPALVAERVGIFEAFGRSNELTDGVRWKILGLLLIVLVATWIFVGIIESLTLPIFGGARAAALVAARGFSLSYFALDAFQRTVTTLLWAVIQTSLYVELRDWKEGPATGALADVFG
ncbi:MAG TPA: hypothetical protein VGF77_13190 [Allosphingosinicella sp.]|jgi:hypothetical protein